MNDDNFSPERIEQLPAALSGNDARLLNDLQVLYQPSGNEHVRSLERVRTRLAQQEALKRTAQAAQNEQPKGKIIAIKDKNVMEDKNISWGMSSSTPLSPTKKRRSVIRIVGISLVAAVAIITILSFTVFSGVLRPAQTANKSTITGAQPPHTGTQQQVISSAKLVCSIGVNDEPLPPFTHSRVLVDWPVLGKAVAHYTDKSEIFSTKDCSGRKALSTEDFNAVGSPDGKKFATSSYSSHTLDIYDVNGNDIKSIPFPQLGAVGVGEIAWSSDSAKLVFLAQEANHVATIKSIDANGENLKTIIRTDGANGARGFFQLSPNAKYALMSSFNFTKQQKEYSIWDVNTGKQMSDATPAFNMEKFHSQAFSPDGSLMAIGGDNHIIIFSTANGQVVSTLDYKKALGLAWSPDGKYIAACNNDISIYDVKAKQTVTTFGKVAANQTVISLAWSPDSTGLVSSIDQPYNSKTPTPVSVWALS